MPIWGPKNAIMLSGLCLFEALQGGFLLYHCLEFAYLRASGPVKSYTFVSTPPLSFAYIGPASLLCWQVHLVWNIELHYTDLLPLIEPGRKIPGSTLNAYGAIIQDMGTNSGDLLVLSSWIPALASGTTKPYYAESTIKDHVLATVSVSDADNHQSTNLVYMLRVLPCRTLCNVLGGRCLY